MVLQLAWGVEERGQLFAVPRSGSDESWALGSASPHLPAQGEDGRGEEGGEREQPSEAVRGEQVAAPALPVALPGHSSPWLAVFTGCSAESRPPGSPPGAAAPAAAGRRIALWHLGAWAPTVGLGVASFFPPLFFLIGASVGGPSGATWQRLDFWWLCFNNKSCSGFYSFDLYVLGERGASVLLASRAFFVSFLR